MLIHVKQNFRNVILGIAAIVYLTAFSTEMTTKSGEEEANKTTSAIGPEDWANYKSWYKVTADEPNTGDPTGFLDAKHKGLKAYRDIFINSVGEATNKGESDFPYPEGTILVKEAFKDKAAWEAQKKPELTIMIKMASGASPETGDWEFVMGGDGKKRGSGTSKWGTFCGSCHINAAATDYNFMNSKTMSD